MPLRAEGIGKGQSFLYGVLSGIVEPIAAALTIWAAGFILPALPYLLSFAAGAMIYVVVEELIPEASAGEKSNHKGCDILWGKPFSGGYFNGRSSLT